MYSSFFCILILFIYVFSPTRSYRNNYFCIVVCVVCMKYVSERVLSCMFVQKFKLYFLIL